MLAAAHLAGGTAAGSSVQVPEVLRYLNVGLISLDGNEICNRNIANFDYTKGKQLTWLSSQLAKFRGDPKIDFIVVYLHHATYSTSDGGGAESVAQQKWAPVFDKYPAKDGTTYITAGGGGQALDKFRKNAPESYVDNDGLSGTPTMRCYKKNSASSTETKVTWSRVRYRGYGITAVDVTPKTGTTPAKMTVRALDEDGVLIDEITIQR